MAFNYDQYIRGGKLPHIWCPGCTYGIVFKSLLRAVDSMKIAKDEHLFIPLHQQPMAWAARSSVGTIVQASDNKPRLWLTMMK